MCLFAEYFLFVCFVLIRAWKLCEEKSPFPTLSPMTWEQVFFSGMEESPLTKGKSEIDARSFSMLNLFSC